MPRIAPGECSSGGGPSPNLVIVGGIVAYNDEHCVQRSVRSLLTQELPPGVRWGRIWVVASVCTDGTAEAVEAIARVDPRVALVVEPERRGKAAAIRQVLSRAHGDVLVLLNSDAVADQGAVAALLAQAGGKTRPFAVMARPLVPSPPDGRWTSTMRWMWEFHHELHLEMLRDGKGAHLSDELLLVSLPALPWIEDGIINDGSYCAVWLRRHSGTCWYAPEARVLIGVPRNQGDHLRQRRRIHVGNAQVAARLGTAPTTAMRFFFEEPVRALRALRAAVKQEPSPRHLVRLAALEMTAHTLAVWDRVFPRRDYVRWTRISTTQEATPSETKSPPATPVGSVGNRELEKRVRLLIDVAREFGTGVPLSQLAELLPPTVAASTAELEKFLGERPDLARLGGGRAFGPQAFPSDSVERVERGISYSRVAATIVHQRLAWLQPWIRCIGVTGSAAYGEPQAGDDLDFYVVTRAGAVPWFLCATYLTLKLRNATPDNSIDVVPCFNYVVDDRRAPTEFANGHGLLFAREALSAWMLLGDDYYRGLLTGAPWLGRELPRLYASRTIAGEDTTPSPAPALVRALSALAFLPLAGYLQAAGLVRNARARRAGHGSAVFRTVTTPARFAFESRRFEQLRERYDGVSDPSVAYGATGVSSRIPTLR